MSLAYILGGFVVATWLWRAVLGWFVKRGTLRYQRISYMGSFLLVALLVVWFIVVSLLWSVSSEAHAGRYGRENFVAAALFLILALPVVLSTLAYARLGRSCPDCDRTQMFMVQSTNKKFGIIPVLWVLVVGDQRLCLQPYSLRGRAAVTSPGSAISATFLSDGQASTESFELKLGDERFVFAIPHKWVIDLEGRIRTVGGSVSR